jgi:CubicO group peptidase (beta-lactamase class C family)
MLKHLVFTTALCLGVAGTSACSEDPAPSPEVPAVPSCEEVPSSLGAELTARIDRLVTERMHVGRVPGLSLVVLKEGTPAYVRGYGLTNLESGQPMTACSRVSVGSTTKSMTALAMMQLVEQGKVDLDAPVTRYLPWFQTADGRGGDILVRHVLSHTAGLPTSSLLVGDMDDGALERRVRSLAQVSLERAPGSGWNYANQGYAIAGLLIQTASGQSYEDYMEAHVFGPMGMAHTSFGPVPEDPAAPRAQGYVWTRGTVQPAPMLLARAQHASGAATYGSARDVAAYLATLLARGQGGQAQVLRPESLERMWQPAAQTGPGESYAFGWYVGTLFGRRAVFHDGSVVGSGSHFLLFPDDGVAVATLGNLNGTTMTSVSQGVAALLLGAEPPPQTPPFYRAPSTFVPDRAVWQQYLGDYQAYSLGRLRLREEAGRLLADVFYTQPTLVLELEAYGDNDFVTRSPLGLIEGVSIAFQHAPDGRILLLVDGQPLGQKL